MWRVDKWTGADNDGNEIRLGIEYDGPHRDSNDKCRPTVMCKYYNPNSRYLPASIETLNNVQYQVCALTETGPYIEMEPTFPAECQDGRTIYVVDMNNPSSLGNVAEDQQRRMPRRAPVPAPKARARRPRRAESVESLESIMDAAETTNVGAGAAASPAPEPKRKQHPNRGSDERCAQKPTTRSWQSSRAAH